MAEKIGKFGYSGLLIMLACGMTILKTWAFDNDTWFILNCGRYVTETGTLPHVEFATIHENLHYVMEQWLTAAIFWKIYSNFGADGLITFAWLIGFILMFVHFKFCLYVSGGNKKVSAILTFILSLFVPLAFIVTRPQIISALLLLIEIFLLEKFSREKKIWTLCLLPVISAFFVNLHAALFPMLIVVMLPFIAESLYQKLKPSQEFEFEIPLKPLILAAAGVFLAGFTNPYGWEAMTFLFTSYNPMIHKVIAEVKPTAADNFISVIFFGFSALLIFAFSKKNIPLRYFFLTFGTMILGFYAFRSTFLFFMLGTFPLAYAAKDLHLFDKTFNLKYKLFLPLFIVSLFEIYPVYRIASTSTQEFHLPIKIISCLSIIFLICFIFFYRREEKLFSEEIFILRRKPLIALAVIQLILFSVYSYFLMPERKYEIYKPAIDFLLKENRAEDIRLWTGFHSGGYAEFRRIKTYLDARPEIFAKSNNHQKDIIIEYLELINGDLSYKEVFSQYNFTHIFITTEEKIPYLMMADDKNFELLFEYDFEQWGKKMHGRLYKVLKND